MKDWEFDVAEVYQLGSYNTEYIGKAYQKKLVEWLWGKLSIPERGLDGQAWVSLPYKYMEELLDDWGQKTLSCWWDTRKYEWNHIWGKA